MEALWHRTENDLWSSQRELCNVPEPESIGIPGMEVAANLNRVSFYLLSIMTVPDPPYLNVPNVFHRGDHPPQWFNPAPEEEGQASGHYDDSETKKLLGLDDMARYTIAGNYVESDLGNGAIQYELAKPTTRRQDSIFLIFFPLGLMQWAASTSFTADNGQVHVKKLPRMNLWNEFTETVQTACQLAAEAKISLPHYARYLVPRLQYGYEPEDRDSLPFPFQLQPYFSPTAMRARITRIVRVMGMLQGFCNALDRLLRPDRPWKYGNPSMLQIAAYDDHDPILRSLARMGVIPTDVPHTVDTSLTEDQVRTALFPAEVNPVMTFDTIQNLSGLDDDALDFPMSHPGYDRKAFHKTGRRTTIEERKHRNQEVYSSDDNNDDVKIFMGNNDDDDPPSPHPPSGTSAKEKSRQEVNQWFTNASSSSVTPHVEPPTARSTEHATQNYHRTRPSARSNNWSNSRGRNQDSTGFGAASTNEPRRRQADFHRTSSSTYDSYRPSLYSEVTRYRSPSPSRRDRRPLSSSYHRSRSPSPRRYSQPFDSRSHDSQHRSPPLYSSSYTPAVNTSIQTQRGSVFVMDRETNELRSLTVFQVDDIRDLEPSRGRIASGFTPAPPVQATTSRLIESAERDYNRIIDRMFSGRRRHSPPHLEPNRRDNRSLDSRPRDSYHERSSVQYQRPRSPPRYQPPVARSSRPSAPLSRGGAPRRHLEHSSASPHTDTSPADVWGSSSPAPPATDSWGWGASSPMPPPSLPLPAAPTKSTTASPLGTGITSSPAESAVTTGISALGLEIGNSAASTTLPPVAPVASTTPSSAPPSLPPSTSLPPNSFRPAALPLMHASLPASASSSASAARPALASSSAPASSPAPISSAADQPKSPSALPDNMDTS